MATMPFLPPFTRTDHTPNMASITLATLVVKDMGCQKVRSEQSAKRALFTGR